jgi:hypothetical protein
LFLHSFKVNGHLYFAKSNSFIGEHRPVIDCFSALAQKKRPARTTIDSVTEPRKAYATLLIRTKEIFVILCAVEPAENVGLIAY